MKKSELQTLRQYVGDPDSLFGIRDLTFNDGPARGMRALEVDNGKGLAMTFLPDRALDIPFLRYKGVNVSFASKVGLRAPAFYVDVYKRQDEGLAEYRITETARAIAAFVDELSNWYVRRCRERFWGKGMDDTKEAAFVTLYTVLVTLSKVCLLYTSRCV